MQNKPDSNINEPKREIAAPLAPGTVGGDSIIVQGNVGVGSNIGSGSVRARHIAAGDMIIHNGAAAESQEEFKELLAGLRAMLIQAKEKGELRDPLAGQALSHLETAAELVNKNQTPPKGPLLKKLQTVTEIINAAVEVVTDDTNPLSILVKALPVAVMLVRLAARLF